MPNSDVELTVNNPRGELETQHMFFPSPRLQSLHGKKIGILKFGTGSGLAEELLPQLEDALRKRIGPIEFREWPAFIAPELRDARSKEIIDYTQTADDTLFHKPDPRVFEPAIKWLSQHKIKLNQVLYIGDGLQDMKAALGAGFSFLGVETGLITAKEFRQQKAKSITNLAKLLEA